MSTLLDTRSAVVALMKKDQTNSEYRGRKLFTICNFRARQYPWQDGIEEFLSV